MQIQEMKAPAGAGPAAESYQEVVALGPGSIHMPSKSPENKPTDKKTVRAYWNERLLSTKDGPHDLLVLVGAARFVDDDNGQSLKAETLKVWLLAEDKKTGAGPKPAAVAAKPATKPAAGPALGGEQGRKPHHLEATGNVVARSRELTIHETSRLVVWFKDVPSLPGGTPGPGKQAPPGRTDEQRAAPAAPAAAPSPANRLVISPPPQAAAGTPPVAPGRDEKTAAPAGPPGLVPAGPAAPAAGPAGSAPPARPIDLSAKSVEAWVLRAEDRNALDKLWTEGSVHVRQDPDPAKPDEKAVDIRGDTLQMKAHPEGNELVVNGDLAQLQMDKIYIIGPEVNIDQATNRAWVHGVGAMQMESATNFQGAKLDRTVPLTVHWNESMLFNGEYAEFIGAIQAEQENARMACDHLQVFFDRPVSLKEGNRADQPAKVRNLVADHNVRVEDAAFEHGQLIKYQRIQGTTLEMNALVPEDDGARRPDKAAEGNEVLVSGPGDVRIMQRGANDALSAPPRPQTAAPGTVPGTPVSVAKQGPERRPVAPARPGEEETMKMTYVSFVNRMHANSKTNTASFWGGVRVLNFPCDNPNEDIDVDAMLARGLPQGVLFIRCDRLKVLDRGGKGRSNQQMQAYGRVRVEAKEFIAEADEVTYEEQKDLVIFKGINGPASLAKVPPGGQQPQVLRGKKIMYKRSTGEASADEVDSITR
jgi:hypothetical protein